MAKETQISQMNEYINELEKRLKNDEYQLRKKEVKFRQIKQGQAVEINKKLRDQQTEIQLLREMVAGSKKELKSKVSDGSQALGWRCKRFLDM